jgi:hypothetical protein
LQPPPQPLTVCGRVDVRRRWYDELTKYAPSLVTVMCYESKKNAAIKLADKADVCIVTPHTAQNLPKTAPSFCGRIYRLVVDEIHTYETSPNSSTFCDVLSTFQPKFVWLVTGTPFTSSLRQLANGVSLLGDPPLLRDVHLQRHYSGPHVPQPTPNAPTLAALRQVMIRHVKVCMQHATPVVTNGPAL